MLEVNWSGIVIKYKFQSVFKKSYAAHDSFGIGVNHSLNILKTVC